jgi:hypothetical protein
MNTALRKARNGFSQTIIFAGEASPELLVELRDGWAALQDRGWPGDPVFKTEAFLTDELADQASSLADFLPYFRIAADFARHAREQGILVGSSWDPTFGWITPAGEDGTAGWGIDPTKIFGPAR